MELKEHIKNDPEEDVLKMITRWVGQEPPKKKKKK